VGREHLHCILPRPSSEAFLPVRVSVSVYVLSVCVLSVCVFSVCVLSVCVFSVCVLSVSVSRITNMGRGQGGQQVFPRPWVKFNKVEYAPLQTYPSVLSCLVLSCVIWSGLIGSGLV
jgi:hypothetical protein